ncbi:MAG: nucleotidyltransferase family protein [Proteocatella sp.]
MYAIILASGNSRRFGGNKLLTAFNGRPLFSYVLDKALELKAETGLEIIVVTQYPEIEAYVAKINDSHKLAGAHKDSMICKSYSQNQPQGHELSRNYIKVIHNPSPEEGIASSIRLGTQAAIDMENEFTLDIGETSRTRFSMMFMVSDQPYLKTQSIKKLMESHQILSLSSISPLAPAKSGPSSSSAETSVISALCYGETSGNPVIFTSDFSKDLLALEGDTGGKSIMKKHMNKGTAFVLNRVCALEEKELFDIDTRNDARN